MDGVSILVTSVITSSAQNQSILLTMRAWNVR